MSLIRCDNLSIAFGDTPLLDDAQFSIERNERVCLIGRNGAGKSTLSDRLRSWDEDIVFSVSATTREPREGEKDGREYFFKSKDINYS